MATVYDAATGKPVPAKPEELAAGFASGALALDANEGPVTIVGDDGRRFTGPADKAAKALAGGGFRLLSPEETLKTQVAKEEGAKGLMGSLEEAGSSALNQAAFGVPETIRDETDTPEARAKREAVEEYHKTARFLGGAAGLGASLAAGGGLFKGIGLAGEAAEHLVNPVAELAHAGLAKELAGKALNAATQGAIISSPQALTQAAFGDPKKAAETLLWGIGTGSVLGVGAELFSQGASAALDGSLKAIQEGGFANKAAMDFSDNQGLKSLGMQSGAARKLGPGVAKDLANTMYEEGYIKPGMTRQEIGDAVSAGHKDAGAQMGEAIDRLDSTVPMGDRQAVRGANSEHVSDVLDRFLKPGELADAIRTNIDSAKMRMPMNRAQAAAYQEVIDSAEMLDRTVVNGREVISFKDAQEFVSDLRKQGAAAVERVQNKGGMKGLQAITPLDQAKYNAFEYVKNALHTAADNVAAASDQPDLVKALQIAKKRYAKTGELEKFARNLDAQDAGNKFVSLTDQIHAGQGMASGVLQSVGAGIGGAIGGAPGAMVGAMAGRVPGIALDFIAKKWFENKGLIYAATYLRRAAKEGPDVFAGVLASTAAKQLEMSMGQVREAVQQLAVRGTTSTVRNTDHMGRLLGSTTGLSSDQQYSKLSDRITTLAGNPGAMAQTVGALTAPLQTSAPEVAQAYQDKMMATLAYLNGSLPKPMAPPMPFAPNNFAPTPAQKMAFHDRAEIVANPMRAMAHVQQGTLSADHLHALQTVYPEIYAQMQQEILKWSAAHPSVKLPLAERQSIAKFLGAPLDVSQSPDSMKAIQAHYAPPPQSGPQGPGKPPEGGTKAKIKKLPSSSTAFSGTQGASELHS